jgi:hypothetical protein
MVCYKVEKLTKIRFPAINNLGIKAKQNKDI